ncbi:MAG: RNA-binding domain-containing protein, partial [Halobacteriales archaeon]|nr:RNA-binding domain-containing protein [Halobacteriales archaeon]
YSTRIESAAGVRHVFDRVRDAPAFETILAELDQRIDEDCSFFLRLDKQAAFQDRVELGEGITLRAKVEAYPAKREAAIENARDAFEA